MKLFDKNSKSMKLLSVVFFATLVANAFTMKQALADVGDSPLVTNTKWSDEDVTYDLGNDLSNGFKNSIHNAAVLTWNGVSGLTFEYSSSSFNDMSMKKQDTPGVTKITSSDGEIVEVNTYFNEDENWNSAVLSDPDSDELDAYTVALHELGHWFRMKDTYDTTYKKAIMYGYISHGERRDLSYADKDAAQAMYP